MSADIAYRCIAWLSPRSQEYMRNILLLAKQLWHENKKNSSIGQKFTNIWWQITFMSKNCLKWSSRFRFVNCWMLNGNQIRPWPLLRYGSPIWLTKWCFIGKHDLTFGTCLNDDVIKWKHFPRYWSFVKGIHRSPVDLPHKDQWRGTLMLSSICAWTNGWTNIRGTGDLRRNLAHYHCNVAAV